MDEQDAEITVPQLDPGVKRLLGRLPDEFWRRSGSFWTPLRHCLRSQGEAIQEGRRALEQAQQAILRYERQHEQTRRAIEELLSNTVLEQQVPRPRTPNPVLDARIRAKQELNSVCADLVPDGHVAMLRTIPPEWARDKLESTRTVSLDNGVGCWFTNTKPEEGLHTRINLINTKHPSGDGLIGFKVYRHSLGIVAKGEAPLLTLASLGYNYSHLCHNGGCFRPEHLEVEPAELTTARNECRGKRILLLSGGGILHPCSHRDWGGSQGYPECILPVKYS